MAAGNGAEDLLNTTRTSSGEKAAKPKLDASPGNLQEALDEI
jgi:hypothetical protein